MDIKKDEKKNENRSFLPFENFSFKKFSKYNLIILLMFFFVAGIGSYFLLSNQATKLAGGSRYNELSSNSGGATRFSLIKRITSFFSQDETVTAKKSSSSENSDEENMDASATASNASTASSSAQVSSGSDSTNMASNRQGQSYSSNSNISNIQRLSSDLSSSNSMESSGGSSTSLDSFDTQKAIRARVGVSGAKRVTAAMPKGNGDRSAMELLKNTYKASLYAARDASNDTARAWTGKAFDITPANEATLEYGENMRAKLDKINPNSIPAFLRDPGLDIDSIRTLKDSSVPGLSSDNDNLNKNLDTEKINDAKNDFENNKNKNLLNNVASLNPMYNFNRNGNSDDDSSLSVDPSNPDRVTDEKAIISADSPAKIGDQTSTWSTDENGYIMVTGSDGIIQVFDPNSGKILGCDNPAAGMCVIPGGSGCPADASIV